MSKTKLPKGAITSESLTPVAVDVTPHGVEPVVPAAPETLSRPPPPAPPPPEYVAPPEADAPSLVEVELVQEVILNGQKFPVGKAMLPADAYDCWKHALKKE